MKLKGIKIVLFFLILVFPIMGMDDFKLINQWDHGEQIFGRICISTIDKDGDVLVGFYKSGIRLITPEKIIAFAPIGEGPNEVIDFRSFVHYKGDIVIFEWSDKGKIFTKKDNTYVLKEILWFKRGQFPHFVTDVFFSDNKWFFAGMANLNFHPKISKICYLKAFDSNRMPLKIMLKDEFKGVNQKELMNFYLAGYKNRLFFFTENELKATVISIKDLEVLNTKDLEAPGFYKPMPPDFYSNKRYSNPVREMIADIEHWKTSYTRIVKVLVEGNYLVLQLRTCDNKLKKFCLLFYNVDNLKLEKTIFIDDFLMGSKDGKYYFYANGKPSLDDDTGNCIINIYTFKKGNGK